MENLLLFGVSVVVCFYIWCWLGESTSVWGYIQRIGLLALLSAPINIDGNVFTVMGNAVSEKSVYSVFSVYQEAKQDAFAIIGLMPNQKAGRSAYIGGGFVGYQEASRGAAIGAGFVGYQKGEAVKISLGLAGYQKADLIAETGIAVAFYQKAGDKERSFSVWSELKGD